MSGFSWQNAKERREQKMTKEMMLDLSILGKQTEANKLFF